ncbi:MAG: sigma-70 family RNA polymerase sigma factor [Acidobacteria bacterium]|nr:sigma-70 family RNA polymerase sigma factor [Acidobacteriota bacterium]
MPTGYSPEISTLLTAWSDGDEQALDALMSIVYPQLRRIARQHLARVRPGHSLESAALANEAYLKMVRAGGIHCQNRLHFLALCSQIIRRILVDHARSRGYAKRGGQTEHVPLDEALLGAKARGIEILVLNQALQSLAEIDAQKAHVVELRYFGGLSVEETAEVLGITPARVKRDWQNAKTWLYGVLTRERQPAFTAQVRVVHSD